jgi:hypothetical protein
MGFEATNPGDGDTARGTQLPAAPDYLTSAARYGLPTVDYIEVSPAGRP